MYVDAFNDRNTDTIRVVERDNDGNRIHKEYPACHMFYYQDPKGRFTSIFGDTLSKFQTSSAKAFKKEKSVMGGKKLFESDMNLVFRCLADNYLEAEPPKLKIAFFDIEVEGHPFAAPNQKMVKVRKKRT